MSDVESFERQFVRFIRAFGLHQPERTPCGEPIPVSHAHALDELSRAELTQAQLAGRLRLDRSVVSRLADALEARGWLERRRHPSDARAVQLVLTPAGRTAADRLAGARRGRLAALLDAVPEDEREAVVRALGVLGATLSGDVSERERSGA